MVQIKIFGQTSKLENNQDRIVDLVKTEVAQLSSQSVFGVQGITCVLRSQRPAFLDGDLPGKSYLAISAPNFKTLCEGVSQNLCNRLWQRLNKEEDRQIFFVEVAEEKNSGIVHGKRLIFELGN